MTHDVYEVTILLLTDLNILSRQRIIIKIKSVTTEKDRFKQEVDRSDYSPGIKTGLAPSDH
jgi:hypothetical protein